MNFDHTKFITWDRASDGNFCLAVFVIFSLRGDKLLSFYTDSIVFLYFQLNADIHETDPELQKIRKDRGYSYMDIITIHKDTLPNYEEKVNSAHYTVKTAHSK